MHAHTGTTVEHIIDVCFGLEDVQPFYSTVELYLVEHFKISLEHFYLFLL